MINHKLQFIYMRVTKTASTSLIKTLRNAGITLEAVGKRDMIPGTTLPNLQHLPSKYIEEAVGEETFESYFKFAFTRNPWDRLLSTYLMARCNRKSPVFNYGKSSHPLSFNNWLSKYDPQASHPTKLRAANPQYSLPMPTTSFTRGADFIGRFENLQKDFNMCCELLDIPLLKLKHLNQRNHKHYSEYYDKETREIVAEKYAKDIEHFGYKF